MANVCEVPIFQRHCSTLKATSHDSEHNEFLSESLFPAIDFDEVKSEFFGDSDDEIFRSNDALLIPSHDNEKYVFIEFKNGKVTSHLKREQIRSKITESLLLFNDILDVKVSFDKNEVIYILVYNKEKNQDFENQRSSSITRISDHIGHLAGTPYLLNEFSRYLKFFKKVHTINNEEFKTLFSDKLDSGTYPF